MAMTVPPLCIIQSRLKSARLPQKMLCKLGDETLIARAWRIACDAFGAEHCVVAIPNSDAASPLSVNPLGDELARISARVYAWQGPENDVLSRFYHAAHAYRWHPDSIIHRWTPDDPWKDPAACRRVAAGERLPVEIGGEAFTLAMLDEAQRRYALEYGNLLDPHGQRIPSEREHITHAIFPTPPPPRPPGVWTIDTEADLIAARERLEQ